MRPGKLDRFRITSPSEPIIRKVAELYGGTARPWQPQGGGASQWEVITESTRLPVLVPPQPVSQWLELWGKRGCERRCDGVTDVITDSPCICGPDPDERLCKPTTRLNVVLADVEGIGVFRLETHGYYAAAELPSAAELLAASNGYISGHLALEERVVKRDGETRRFMVPTLEVGATPAQLMAGAAGSQPKEIEDESEHENRALELPPAPPLDVDSVRAALQAAESLDDLRALWPDAREAGLQDYWKEVGAQFQSDKERATTLWSQIIQTVPEDWTNSIAEEDFFNVVGVKAEDADAGQMEQYLEHLVDMAS